MKLSLKLCPLIAYKRSQNKKKERITEIILLLNWGDLMADPFFNELPFFKNT